MKWGSWAAVLAAATTLGACGDSSERSEDSTENLATQQSNLKGTAGAKVGDSDYCGLLK
jgi:hypothetical protein